MRFLTPAYLIVTWLACFGVGMAPARAQEPAAAAGITEISVCTQEWEGDTNTDMTGLYWETLIAVFEPLGIKINPTYMPYKISIVRVRDKTCDIAMGGYMDEFPDLLYPHWPHETEAVIAVHAIDTEFKDKKSFIGKKIAWLSEYGFEAYLPAEIDYEEVRSEALALRMLERGRIDYFVDYVETVNKAAAETGIDLSGYTLSPVAALSELVYPMFRRDDRGATLVGLYDRRMAELHKDGALDRLFEKHLNGRYPAPSGY
jgi:polar amino acid transport system substrate-binding protein